MKKTVLNAAEVSETILRMADEILEVHSPPNNLVLVGILTGGAILAQRLKKAIATRTGVEVDTGVLDISLYRDDWTRIGPKPIVRKTEINFSIDDKRVILVDDVLFTGRTVRAAMDALTDFGRPSRIELAVLADRGHRELPICTNFAGLQLDTDLDERVNVYFSDLGRDDEVAVESTG